MRRFIAALVVGALLLTCPIRAQSRVSSVPYLVTTTWLADHFEDAKVVLLWTGFMPPEGALIPRTRVVPHASLMAMQNGQHELAATNDFEVALRNAGVSDESHMVIYGEPMAAGWLFFALDYFGHNRASMLDGGVEKWRAEGRQTGMPLTAVARGAFTTSIRTGLKATADDVQRAVGEKVVVLDARSAKEYEAGHIPGAKLLPWVGLYADQKLGIMKTRDELSALFQSAGAVPGAKVVTYCQIGLRSSVLYFAARYAGFDVRNYVGSWTDWTSKGLASEPAQVR